MLKPAENRGTKRQLTAELSTVPIDSESPESYLTNKRPPIESSSNFPEPVDAKITEFITITQEMRELCQILHAKEQARTEILSQIEQLRAETGVTFAGSSVRTQQKIPPSLQRLLVCLKQESVRPSVMVNSEETVRKLETTRNSLDFQLNDIPDTAFIFVLQHVDFIQRLQLRRLCKGWRHLLSEPVLRQQTNVSRDTIFAANRQRIRALCTGHQRSRFDSFPDHHRALEFQTVIFNGHYSPFRFLFGLGEEEIIVAFLTSLIQGSRKLTRVVLANVILGDLPDWSRWVGDLPLGFPGLTLLNSFADILPSSFTNAHRGLFDQSTGIYLPATNSGHSKYLIRLPETVDLSSTARVDEFIQSLQKWVWPYPPDQLTWLYRSAPSLHVNQPLMAWFSNVYEWYMPFVRRDPRTGAEMAPNGPRIRPRTIACPEHQQFCEHLGLEFYEKMQPQMRCLLAVCLMQERRRHGSTTGIDSPPYPFCNFGMVSWDRNHGMTFTPLK